VIVIGLNPAPAADLAPFCVRTTRGGSHGAMVLKITRESVVKAVSHGLKPAEIVARLKRHASNEVPANVLREVQDWSNWVRHVTTSTLTVLRCPDRDTADRVMGAFKRHAQRVNDTLVAIDQKKLTSTERNKLRDHGIIVQGGSEAQESKSKVRKKQKRW
jgi:Helicase conserved C-terminal domain